MVKPVVSALVGMTLGQILGRDSREAIISCSLPTLTVRKPFPNGREHAIGKRQTTPPKEMCDGDS